MSRTEFTEEGYEVVTNIWGDDIPRRLDQINTDTLWDIQHRASTAATDSWQEDAPQTKAVLLMIEAKTARVLSERCLRDDDDEGGGLTTDGRPKPA